MLSKDKSGNYWYDGHVVGDHPSIARYYDMYVKEKPSYDFSLYYYLKRHLNIIKVEILENLMSPIDEIIVYGDSSQDTWIEITEIKTKLNTEDYPGPQVETIFIGRRI